MRRPNDPKDPKSPGEDKPTPGGHARDRMDLFNKQRGLPTESDVSGKKVEPEADQAPPKSKKPED